MREDGNYVSFFTWCKATQRHCLSWRGKLNGVIFHGGCYLSVVSGSESSFHSMECPGWPVKTFFLYLSFLLLVSGPHEPRIEYLWLARRASDTNPVREEAVVKYGYESWTSHIKKAKHPRIDAFELWCWRKLSRVPWTARRSNKSILKEINPEYSLEGLMLKLKL